MGSASGIIGLTVGIIVVVFIFTFFMLRKSGAFGMSKKKQAPLDEDGIPMVWDIFENCYVTLGYWRWVNGLD